MKDVFKVLDQKEADLARVRRELESLTIAAPLLAEDDLSLLAPKTGQDAENETPAETISSASDAEATGTDGLPSISHRPRLWSSLKRRD